MKDSPLRAASEQYEGPLLDSFWMGAFTVIIARATFWLRQGRAAEAARELDLVLSRYAETPKCDHELLKMVAPWWEPHEEGDPLDQDVL
jgi:hypothetical protein